MDKLRKLSRHLKNTIFARNGISVEARLFIRAGLVTFAQNAGDISEVSGKRNENIVTINPLPRIEPTITNMRP